MNPGALRAASALALLSGVAAVGPRTGVLPPGTEAVGTASGPVQPVPVLPQPRRDAGRVAAMLTRPLFSPGRRPTPGVPTAARAEPPRLTGTLLGPFGRRAVFAGTGKPVSAGEGDSLGTWTVQAITAGFAVLSGPDGRRELRVVPAAGPASDRFGVAGETGVRPFWSNPCGRPHRRRPGGGAATSDTAECRAALAALAPAP